MRVLIFGATGMVGGGVLRECLLAADVERVVSIGRSALLLDHSKLVQVVRPNFATDVSVWAKPSCNCRRDQVEAVEGDLICLATAQGSNSAT